MLGLFLRFLTGLFRALLSLRVIYLIQILLVREWELEGMGITNGKWEGNENKTKLNLGSGMGMGVNHWEWD